ncbi:MAG: endonuclease/exonuclease/phosphatase family protein [Flavobacteriales bacterium]|nr:endonuclease/exonuclease/phosphatase family protein [Flavobacteriales bacterium]
MMDRKKFNELRMAMMLLVFAVIAALAPDSYLPMLARAFILPGAVLFAGFAGLAASRRKWWIAQSAAVGCAIMVIQVPSPFAATAVNGEGFRVFHMNVLQPNTAFQEAVAQALAIDADVLSVQEVGPEWAIALSEGLRVRYPYAHIEPRTNCYGIALFSKVPFTQVRTIAVQGTPFIEALVEVNGQPVRLLAVHAASPTNYGYFRKRNEQLRILGEYLARQDKATVVVGDLNTVPWDSAFQRFCARTGLRATTATLQRTWPSVGPFALIPLDHLLISPGIATASVRTVYISGSDHRGLLADLEIIAHEH